MEVSIFRSFYFRTSDLTNIAARRSHRIYVDICWRPYDIQFKELLTGLQYHRKLVQTEVQFATYQKVLEMHKKMVLDCKKREDELRILNQAKEEDRQWRELEQRLEGLVGEIEDIKNTASSMKGELDRMPCGSLQANWSDNEESYRGKKDILAAVGLSDHQ